MTAGHEHTHHNSKGQCLGQSQDETQRLLCELFDPATSKPRRDEIRATLSACPHCQDRIESERAVRAMVRDCCRPASAPEPLRQRIITSITYTSYTEIRYS